MFGEFSDAEEAAEPDEPGSARDTVPKARKQKQASVNLESPRDDVDEGAAKKKGRKQREEEEPEEEQPKKKARKSAAEDAPDKESKQAKQAKKKQQ